MVSLEKVDPHFTDVGSTVVPIFDSDCIIFKSTLQYFRIC